MSEAIIEFTAQIIYIAIGFYYGYHLSGRTK